MKNRKFERNRKLQKQYMRSSTRHFEEGGITVRHEYNEPDKKTWWDDTGFVLNGRYIAVWFIHPRMEFDDAISSIAHDNVPHPRQTDMLGGLFEGGVKNYKKLGRSGRKRHIFTSMSPGTPEQQAASKKWLDDLNNEKFRLHQESTLVVKPNMKVEILDWCRGVGITAPIEVKGAPDLRILCNLVRRILKNETTLDKEFPDYTYTKDDWVAENETPPTGLFSHAVKM